MRVSAQFYRFLIVGILATTVNYSVFWFLLQFLGGGNYILASGLGFISGVIAGYIPNKKWSFESEEKQKFKIFKYILVYTTSLLISILVLHVLVEIVKVNVRIANFMGICLTTLTNFIGVRLFVFPNVSNRCIQKNL